MIHLLPKTFVERRRVDERMDNPDLDAALHRQALRGLQRINSISRSAQILWRAIERWSNNSGNTPLRVLDVASGGGDVALNIATMARASKRNIQVDGCDRNPSAVAHACEQALTRRLDARFFVVDALVDPLPEGYDIITSTLFLHHLDESDAVLLLKKLGSSAHDLVLVDDLIRSRLGHALAVVGCRLLSRSPVVHYDGPASVRGAFTTAEALDMATRAGLTGATITTHWPQRFLMCWSRSQ